MPNETATPEFATRWWLVALVSGLFLVAFYAYEHNPEMYAGGARESAGEDSLRDKFVDEQASGSLQRQLAILSYAAVGGAAMLLLRSPKWEISSLGLASLMLLLFWAATTTLFADEPGVSIRRLIAAGLVLVGSIGFARLLRPHEIISVALITLTLFVSASLAIDILAGGRPWAGGERFAGTMHPNTLAMYCGTLCLAAATQPVGFGSRWIPRSLLIFGLVAMVLTRSRTGLVAVVLSLIIAWVVRLEARTRWVAVAFVVSFAAFAVVALASMNSGQRFQLRNTVLMGRTEQAGSLTGRVPLWEELAGYVRQRPLVGYGYEGFWTPRRMDLVLKSQGWALQSAHNAYLEVTLQMGLIGLTFVLAFVGSSLIRLQGAFELTRNPGYAFAIGVIFLGLLDSLLQSHFNSIGYPSVLALTCMLSAILFYPAADAQPVVSASGSRARSPLRFPLSDLRQPSL